MAKVSVRIRKNGGLLAIDNPSETVFGIVTEALSYTRVVQLRGKEAKMHGSNVKTIPIACYTYTPAREGFQARLITSSGFLWTIARNLREHGYHPVVKDERPEDPKKFKPAWQRLRGVDWRYKQRFCIEQMLKYSCGRIDCPPGYGKSMLMRLFCQLLPGAETVVSTHSLDVLTQIHDELSKSIPRVGMISGKRKIEGDGIHVVSGKSLHRVDWPVDIFLVDEVHEFATDHYLNSVGAKSFQYARKYGFSASQSHRMDLAHFELEGPFGPVIARVSYRQAVEHGCIVPIQIWWRNVNIRGNPAAHVRSPVERDRWGLWTNDARNALIAEDARQFDDDDQVLIAVETIEHAMNLKRLLPEFSICHSENGLSEEDRLWYITNEFIPPNEPRMTAERRYKLKKAFEAGRLRKVIANSVWKRGVDFRQLAVLIRADGKNSAISDTQIPGRTSRTCEETGKEFSVVVDYLDEFDDRLHGRALDRATNYSANGWEQIQPRTREDRRQRRLFDE